MKMDLYILRQSGPTTNRLIPSQAFRSKYSNLLGIIHNGTLQSVRLHAHNLHHYLYKIIMG
jgi:hypothetical protein